PGKASDSTTYARAITRYKVRRGDTVTSVAEEFGVSPKMVRVWNRLKGDSLGGRKMLFLQLPGSPGAAQVRTVTTHSKSRNARTKVAAKSGMVHHKVKRGETLTSIAGSYNTTVSALKKDNRNIATLRSGMILIVRDAR